MRIINHVIREEHGWLAEDMAHTLEAEFPD
jgi:hypothetical protein